ncbi:hypothetical protein LAZ67_2003989 [Cordylochernes scorpioides]|uniref:Uncharacterized protein n=1 Tax=Cordylochernes scorpioides TaxID=51811 RepID=A0ABY6K3N7_9ARAC|nr:hypothetical protein LAZ67_2003989 [Cordylochernes scorpioides]
MVSSHVLTTSPPPPRMRRLAYPAGRGGCPKDQLLWSLRYSLDLVDEGQQSETSLQKIDMDTEQQLYTPKIENIAVIEMYGDI